MVLVSRGIVVNDRCRWKGQALTLRAVDNDAVGGLAYRHRILNPLEQPFELLTYFTSVTFQRNNQPID